MTDAELNEKVAIAMGWTKGTDGGWQGLSGMVWAGPPNFIDHEPEFARLLLWHAANGRFPVVAWTGENCYGWLVELRDGGANFNVVATGMSPVSPARALAMATISAPVADKEEEA